MEENAQVIPQGKAYQLHLKNTQNKAELVDWFTQYIQHDQVRSKLKGNVVFNSRDITYHINRSDLKTLFTSNNEEPDTKIVYWCSSFNKPCIVKAKEASMY